MTPKPLRKNSVRRKWRTPVTVCVAAMAEYLGNRLIIAASDRMVTSGDIEFEQDQRKIHNLTSAIAIMVAGDLTLQATILHEVQAWANERIANNPTEWILVKDAAEIFHECVINLKKKMAREAIQIGRASCRERV